MNFLHPIKRARLATGISLEDAAFFLSVHKTTLQRYERGELPIPRKLLPDLTRLYRIPAEELFHFQNMDFCIKCGFYIFHWQPSRASPHPELLSYLEALSIPGEEALLSCFRRLDGRAKHQIYALALLLDKKSPA